MRCALLVMLAFACAKPEPVGDTGANDDTDDTDDTDAGDTDTGGPTGLVARYAFDGDYTDSSGAGNHGRAVGSPSFATGVTGQALRVADTADYASVADSPSLDLAETVTLVAWVLPVATPPNPFGRVVTKGSNAVEALNYSIWMGDNASSALRFRFIAWDGGQVELASQTEVTPAEWNMLAVSFDKGSVRVYLNGELDNEGVVGIGTLPTNDLDLAIGWDAWRGEWGFAGDIDEVSVWNRALAPEEIRQMYNALAGPI